MLSHDTEEKQTGTVDIKEADATCIKKCIDFIYTGLSPELDDDIERLMYSAHLLQLTTLCSGIFELLNDELSLKTFFLTQRLADMYNNKQLIKNCDCFLLKNLVAISKMEEFGHFEKSFIERMLDLKEVEILEANKLDALLRWVKFKPTERITLIGSMMKYVTLSKISVSYIRHFIENETLIKEDCKLLLNFSVALMDKVAIRPRAVETSQSPSAIAVFDIGSGYLQSFDPRDNTWCHMHQMNNCMKQGPFTAVCVGDYIFVFMKNKSIYRLYYSCKTETWEHTGNTIDDHGSHFPIIGFGDCIYVIGGYDGVSTKSVEKFDTFSNECMKLTDKPHACRVITPVILNYKLYCCGGYLDGRYTNRVDCFDLKASAWTTLAPMNENKCSMAAVAFNGKILVFGGWNGNVEFQTVESYDPLSDRWSILKNMNTRRHLFRSFEINEDIYVVGGERSSKTIERYDITKSKWTDAAVPVGISRNLVIVESVKIQLMPLSSHTTRRAVSTQVLEAT